MQVLIANHFVLLWGKQIGSERQLKVFRKVGKVCVKEMNTSEPLMKHPVHEGKNVSAYIHFISTTTNTKTLHLEGTNYVFYFKVKNEDVAKGYWMGSSIGAKMLLNIVFKPYPVMKETVSNLDTKEFDKDPISLIRTFDNLLK